MQLANQHHQPIYHKFTTQLTGLRPIHFNQVQSQIHAYQRVQVTGHKIVDLACPITEFQGNHSRIDGRENEETSGIMRMETANVNVTGAIGARLSQDLENIPNTVKRQSLNVSQDLYSKNKVNSYTKKKQFRSNLQEKLDFKKNMEREQILNKFPQILLGPKLSCHTSISSKNVQTEAVHQNSNLNDNKTCTDKIFMTVDGQFVKPSEIDAPLTSRETRDFQECEIFPKNTNRILLSRFSQSPSKSKYGSQKSMNSSCSTSTTTNSTMYESTILQPAAVPSFFLNKLANNPKKQARVTAGSQTQDNQSEESKGSLQKAIIELETQICQQRTLTKQKQDKIQELQKLLLQNSIKYQTSIIELQKECIKKSQMLLCQLRQEHEKQICGVITQINQISNKQLSQSVARFQTSIQNVQGQYQKYRILNESEKSQLLGRIGEFQDIVKKLTLQIATFEGSSVFNKVNTLPINKDCSTLSIEQLQHQALQKSQPTFDKIEEMEAKLSKQQKYISKQQKKLKQYKAEYERTFHRAQDYRIYLQQNQMVIKNLERDMRELEKDVQHKNKENEKLGFIVNSCCQDLMKSQLQKLNQKYSKLNELDGHQESSLPTYF